MLSETYLTIFITLITQSPIWQQYFKTSFVRLNLYFTYTLILISSISLWYSSASKTMRLPDAIATVSDMITTTTALQSACYCAQSTISHSSTMTALGTSQFPSDAGGSCILVICIFYFLSIMGGIYLLLLRKWSWISTYHILYVVRINYGNKINSEDSIVVIFFGLFSFPIRKESRFMRSWCWLCVCVCCIKITMCFPFQFLNQLISFHGTCPLCHWRSL